MGEEEEMGSSRGSFVLCCCLSSAITAQDGQGRDGMALD